MRMHVRVDVASARVHAVVVLPAGHHVAFVEADHIGPDLVDVERVRVVHHLGGVAPGRPRVDL